MSDQGGRLSVCATPIGNLGDVTLRVLEVLRAADVVLAEDTRVTAKLLARYEIEARVERYDDHTAQRRIPRVLERIEAGEHIALVSDAGTPGISDPGALLVEAALDAELPVEVLPGASATLTALVASGLPTHSFYFGGFLPRKRGERERLLARLAPLDATLVFYESPNRCAATLEVLAETFPGRSGALTRELTKVHEEVVRGPLSDVAREISGRERVKGEVVLLVGPPSPDETTAEPLEPEEVRARVDAFVAVGMRRTEAVRRVADETGLPRHSVYEAAHSG